MRKLVLLPIFILIIIVVAFFAPFFIHDKLPIPADTIIGLYHPFRDLYAKDYPNGIPFKNFLITDPVRQQYPWRWVSVTAQKAFELPLWNPYAMAGIPLLANGQSAAFYPLNIILFLIPFQAGWSLLIIVQPILAGLFLYLYLRNLRLNPWASILGALSFSFCGFFVAWLEWGTVLHVALWLPLVLLSIDKMFIFSTSKAISNIKYQIVNKQIRVRKNLVWSLVFILSLVCSFLAGHVQTFFYLFVVCLAYIIARFIQLKPPAKVLFGFIICLFLFAIITAVQWIPSAQLVSLSARNIDQDWQKAGWFIPWENSIQFIAPDFFGNPATGNYWGVWNYAEFVGYVGIIPLLFAIFALFFRRDKKTLFFGLVLIGAFLFAFPTIFAQIPFLLHVPLLSTSQPTRLIFLVDFALAVLAAFGMDYYLKTSQKTIIPVLLLFVLIFAGLWSFIIFGEKVGVDILMENVITAKRNLYIPTLLSGIAVIILFANLFLKNKNMRNIIIACIIGITIFDLFRFAQKFTPFTDRIYLFPTTRSISFLQHNTNNYRIMAVDDQILPPNFQLMYKLQSVEGYDPLYLQRYGELIIASERKKADISGPFGFNRIITPHNFESSIIDLLGVKYILSLHDIQSPKLVKVFQEGQTRIYENKQVVQRAFFVTNVIPTHDKQSAINTILSSSFDPKKSAVVEQYNLSSKSFTPGSAHISSYRDNSVVVTTSNTHEGFLVLTETYYPTWSVLIDGKQGTIVRADYNFRGVIIPAGEHRVVFSNSLL